jgi:hypothetical protein
LSKEILVTPRNEEKLDMMTMRLLILTGLFIVTTSKASNRLQETAAAPSPDIIAALLSPGPSSIAKERKDRDLQDQLLADTELQEIFHTICTARSTPEKVQEILYIQIILLAYLQLHINDDLSSKTEFFTLLPALPKRSQCLIIALLQTLFQLRAKDEPVNAGYLLCLAGTITNLLEYYSAYLPPYQLLQRVSITQPTTACALEAWAIPHPTGDGKLMILAPCATPDPDRFEPMPPINDVSEDELRIVHAMLPEELFATILVNQDLARTDLFSTPYSDTSARFQSLLDIHPAITEHLLILNTKYFHSLLPLFAHSPELILQNIENISKKFHNLLSENPEIIASITDIFRTLNNATAIRNPANPDFKVCEIRNPSFHARFDDPSEKFIRNPRLIPDPDFNQKRSCFVFYKIVQDWLTSSP